MKGLLAIYRRELSGLFLGPLAWILLGIALLLNGYLFTLYLKSAAGDLDVAMRYSLGDSFVFWVLVVLVPPLLTMRMISEESRSGMIEFLLTAPVSDAAVVVGKFLAATTFMGLLWGAVFVYVITVTTVGPAADWGALVSGYAGALLVSGLFTAIGLFASSLTSTPIIAAFAAIVFNLVLVLLPLFAGLSDFPWFTRLVAHVHVIDHLKSAFLIGVLDSAYVVFFVAWTALFLFAAVRALEARRWN
jgi:ABC-2 type transport system permease protein